jgi:hypothetical protein
MAAGFPESYQDPLYAQLDAANEQKLSLPVGLLQSIRTAGEKTNASQVSSAGATTPYQFTPITRKAILDKFGIDVTLSPENASEGAGLLLRDSLQRGKGDIELAVREYHGGTNPKNWGKVNDAYAARVLAGQQSSKMDALSTSFAKFMAENPAVPQQFHGMTAPGNIDLTARPKVKNADGSVSTVRSLGVNIDGQEVLIPTVSDDGRIMSDQEAIDAYTRTGRHLGKFDSPAASDAYAQKLHSDQEKQYGLDPLAQSFGQWLASGAPKTLAEAIPRDANLPPPTAADAVTPAANPSLVDQIIGGGETALSLATGALPGAIGALGGTAKGLIGSVMSGTYGTQEGVRNVEQSAAEGMNALTYAPRTEAGRQQTGAVGEAMAAALPVMPLTAELGSASRAASAATAGARDLSAASVQRIRVAAPAIAERVQRTLSRNPEPAAGTRGSVGAAGTDMATQRIQSAESLPVPIKLTEGQATRNPDQLRFENETAKGQQGGAIRDRYSDQNADLQKNFDAWVDQTGKTTSDVTETGKAVDQVLRKELERDKAEVNVRYRVAEKSPEALERVDPGEVVSIGQGDNAIEHSVISYLNSKPSGLSTTALTDHAKQYALKLGAAELADDGSLVARPTNVKTMESLRKEISQATGFEPTARRDSAILKGLIDAQTEPVAGPLYRDARRARENLAKKWENRSVVADLVNNKRGMDDRKVAIEDVFKHIVLDSDRSELSHMRRVLQTGGEQGQQAWRELQGQTVEWIKSEALKNVATDQRGNRIVSAAQLDKAIEKLDKKGKLDFIFGKQGAQQMRDMNELAKVVMTVPPGAVNTSNTASVLLAALTEAGVTGSMTGLPVPVLSSLRLLAKYAKNRQLQKRIEQALSGRAATTPPPQPARPAGATLH